MLAIRSEHQNEFEVEFIDFYHQLGLSHNFFAPRILQHNGVVNRKNITLEDGM